MPRLSPRARARARAAAVPHQCGTATSQPASDSRVIFRSHLSEKDSRHYMLRGEK